MADSSLPVAAEQPTATAAGAINDVSPGHKVVLSNLAYSLTDEDLRAAVPEELAADIESCQVVTRETSKGTRSVGYGFIVLATADAAEKVVATFDGKDIQGRPVRARLTLDKEEGGERKGPRKSSRHKYPIRRGESRRGNRPVPREATEADAAAASDGKPASQEDKENRPDGQPAKQRRFRSKKKSFAKAKASQEGTPAESGGEASAPVEAEKPKRVRRTRKPRRAEGEEPQGVPSTTTLFVANLPFSLDDDGLGALFTEEGFAVKSARVVRRHWGNPRKSKGYGFVELASEEEQAKAIAALEGKVLSDRQIAVKVAVDPAKRDENETAEAAAEPTQ